MTKRHAFALVAVFTMMSALYVILFRNFEVPPSVRFDPEKKVIFVEGPIDRNMYEEIKRQNLKGYKSLSIKSLGGSKTFAFKILQILWEYDLDLIVNSYCVSACASTIFVGATNRYVEYGATVALHGSSNSFLLIQEELYERGLYEMPPSSKLKRLVDIENHIARRSGVSGDLFYVALVFSDEICFASTQGKVSQPIGIGFIPGVITLSKAGWSLFGVEYQEVAPLAEAEQRSELENSRHLSKNEIEMAINRGFFETKNLKAIPMNSCSS